MLSLASWEHIARPLDYGRAIRTDHDCGGGRTLTVRHDDRGYHAFCFRCNDSGWLPPAPVPLAERLARLKQQTEADNQFAASCDLPEPRVTSWAEWPANARLWLLKAGLSSADLPRLGAYYHPPSDRVVLPVLMGGRAVFWQARALDGRQPKYLAPPVDKKKVLACYGNANEVTLTEDILSAYKVGRVAEGWAMLGTSLSMTILGPLIARQCQVNVWLDPDAAGIKASSAAVKTLRAAGIKTRVIKSDRDPKLLHLEKIKEILCLPSQC